MDVGDERREVRRRRHRRENERRKGYRKCKNLFGNKGSQWEKMSGEGGRGKAGGKNMEIQLLVIPRKHPDPTEDRCLLIHTETQPAPVQSPAVTLR